MTPKGVEHFSHVPSGDLLEIVNPTMTPKGVEHYVPRRSEIPLIIT